MNAGPALFSLIYNGPLFILAMKLDCIRPKIMGQARTKGLAQNLENLNGGAEPRLTSGGEAATMRA